MKEDSIEVRALSLGEMYEFKVVAVDGDYMTESDPQEVETYGIGKWLIQYGYLWPEIPVFRKF